MTKRSAANTWDRPEAYGQIPRPLRAAEARSTLLSRSLTAASAQRRLLHSNSSVISRPPESPGTSLPASVRRPQKLVVSTNEGKLKPSTAAGAVGGSSGQRTMPSFSVPNSSSSRGCNKDPKVASTQWRPPRPRPICGPTAKKAPPPSPRPLPSAPLSGIRPSRIRHLPPKAPVRPPQAPAPPLRRPMSQTAFIQVAPRPTAKAKPHISDRWMKKSETQIQTPDRRTRIPSMRFERTASQDFHPRAVSSSNRRGLAAADGNGGGNSGWTFTRKSNWRLSVDSSALKEDFDALFDDSPLLTHQKVSLAFAHDPTPPISEEQPKDDHPVATPAPPEIESSSSFISPVPIPMVKRHETSEGCSMAVEVLPSSTQRLDSSRSSVHTPSNIPPPPETHSAKVEAEVLATRESDCSVRESESLVRESECLVPESDCLAREVATSLQGPTTASSTARATFDEAVVAQERDARLRTPSVHASSLKRKNARSRAHSRLSRSSLLSNSIEGIVTSRISLTAIVTPSQDVPVGSVGRNRCTPCVGYVGRRSGPAFDELRTPSAPLRRNQMRGGLILQALRLNDPTLMEEALLSEEDPNAPLFICPPPSRRWVAPPSRMIATPASPHRQSPPSNTGNRQTPTPLPLLWGAAHNLATDAAAASTPPLPSPDSSIAATLSTFAFASPWIPHSRNSLGPSANSPSVGLHPLLIAARSSMPSVLQKLVDGGAAINAVDSLHRNALHVLLSNPNCPGMEYSVFEPNMKNMIIDPRVSLHPPQHQGMILAAPECPAAYSWRTESPITGSPHTQGSRRMRGFSRTEGVQDRRRRYGKTAKILCEAGVSLERKDVYGQTAVDYAFFWLRQERGIAARHCDGLVCESPWSEAVTHVLAYKGVLKLHAISTIVGINIGNTEPSGAECLEVPGKASAIGNSEASAIGNSEASAIGNSETAGGAEALEASVTLDVEASAAKGSVVSVLSAAENKENAASEGAQAPEIPEGCEDLAHLFAIMISPVHLHHPAISEVWAHLGVDLMQVPKGD